MEQFLCRLSGVPPIGSSFGLIVGDFNFYRYSYNRNRHGANVTGMATFNEIISYMGFVELPIKGRLFTWSNMQSEPLLE
jgi:hypothetical protein